MQPLRLALIQSDIHWENTGANLAALEEKIWQLEQPADVIVLPEMFNTGFSMNVAGLAEVMGLTTFRWMKQMAAQTGALMLGSYMVSDSGKFYNRLLWMEPSGAYQTYDKRHLFSIGKEDETFTQGTTRLIAEWKGWRIIPLICYDLRFPAWCRNRYDREKKILAYDVMIIVANWPSPRINAWNTLLAARAIENLCFTAGVNRVGVDGAGLFYPGRSSIYSFKGETVFLGDENEQNTVVTLDPDALRDFRSVFPAYLDGDDFEIR